MERQHTPSDIQPVCSKRHSRSKEEGRTQEEQQQVVQEGMPQPKKVSCIRGKLQITIPRVSTVLLVIIQTNHKQNYT